MPRELPAFTEVSTQAPAWVRKLGGAAASATGQDVVRAGATRKPAPAPAAVSAPRAGGEPRGEQREAQHAGRQRQAYAGGRAPGDRAVQQTAERAAQRQRGEHPGHHAHAVMVPLGERHDQEIDRAGREAHAQRHDDGHRLWRSSRRHTRVCRRTRACRRARTWRRTPKRPTGHRREAGAWPALAPRAHPPVSSHPGTGHKCSAPVGGAAWCRLRDGSREGPGTPCRSRQDPGTPCRAAPARIQAHRVEPLPPGSRRTVPCRSREGACRAGARRVVPGARRADPAREGAGRLGACVRPRAGPVQLSVRPWIRVSAAS